MAVVSFQHVVSCQAQQNLRQHISRRCGASPIVNRLHKDGLGASGSLQKQLIGPLAAAPRWLQQRLPLLFHRQTALTPPHAVAGGGNGDNTGGPGEGGSGGDGDGNQDDDRVLNLKEVEAFARENNLKVPKDMLETAAQHGLRLSALTGYLGSQKIFLVGLITRLFPYFRDRLLADPLFFFKVGVEVAIDSGCCTVAEVRKRGDKFWKEFEFYLSDILVGLVLDVVLVSLMAPAAVIGGKSKAAMATGLQKLLAKVPSAVFEANIPGVKTYSVGARSACLLVKFLEYSLAGIACGFVGQAVANYAMETNRALRGPGEDDVPVPPLFKTALVWGLFMGVSSNLRYQTVFGIERLVDLTIAKKVPAVAYATTVAVRFANNVIGGENFIDMARWAGVQ